LFRIPSLSAQQVWRRHGRRYQITWFKDGQVFRRSLGCKKTTAAAGSSVVAMLQGNRWFLSKAADGEKACCHRCGINYLKHF